MYNEFLNLSRKWQILFNYHEILLKVSKYKSFSDFSDNLVDYKTKKKAM